MSRLGRVLDALEPLATASLCEDEMEGRRLSSGNPIIDHSRCGKVAIHMSLDDGTPPISMFVSIALAAASVFVNVAFDQFDKSSEFK